MNKQSGISKILIILIIVGVLVVAGGIYWYWQNQKAKEVKQTTFQDLLSFNSDFKSFIEKAIEKYPQLSPDKFTEKESTQIKITGEGFSEFSGSNDPVWTFSPDKTKAVSSLGYYGEPDSSLEIYNRKGDEKKELLLTCGTPCFFRGEFWLNNMQFVFIETEEYYPPNGEARCTVDTKCTEVMNIYLYDIEKGTQTVYQSLEIDKPILLPSWPARETQIKAACERLYGADDPYCESTD